MRTRHAMKKLRLRRRILSLVFALTLMLSCLTACGSKTTDAQPSASDKKLQIVTTIFPEYDWVKQILGDQADQAEVTMLLDNGVDLHSYQPTTEDMLKISNCDVFIYVGGESDKWVDKALKQAANKDMKVINLMEIMGDDTKEEEIVEGMQAEEEEGQKKKARSMASMYGCLSKMQSCSARQLQIHWRKLIQKMQIHIKQMPQPMNKS